MVVCLLSAVVAAASLFAVVSRFLTTHDEPMRPLNSVAHDAGWRAVAQRAASSDEVLRATPTAEGVVELSNERLDIDADRCPTPMVEIAGPAATAPFSYTLSWRRLEDPTTYHIDGRFQPGTATAASDKFTLRFAELPIHPAWTGRVTGVTWRFSGLSSELDILTVGAPAATGAELTSMLWRQWRHRDAISASSNNSVRAPHVLGFSPNGLLVLAMLSVAGCYVAVAAARRSVIRPVVLVVIPVAAWLANDARWMAGQARQLEADFSRFGVATTPTTVEAACWPARIAQMATLVRTHVPTGMTYAVVGGNLSLGDSRLRYLLAPDYVQVNLDELHPRVAPDAAEYIVVLDRGRVEFDSAEGILSTAGLAPVPVSIEIEISNGLLICRRTDG
ncbi:MAG: hypothetical protein V3T70_01550 [Phycisphaerae bacterium]